MLHVFFCTLSVFIALASLVQLCLGIYLTFIQSDLIIINQLVKTDQFDSYLFYILIVFIGLGLISLALSFFSIYSVVRRLKSLSFFLAVLWVSFHRQEKKESILLFSSLRYSQSY